MRALKNLYARLVPLGLRDRLRPLKTPRQTFLHAVLRVWSGGQVVGGPFARMKFPAFMPINGLILGTWEKELHPLWPEILARKPEHLINVGAAEGYYAVGLARTDANLRVTAFEMVPEQQQRASTLAAANGLSDRVVIYGRCEPENFAACLSHGRATLIVMDVEGYETVLLDPVKIPALAHTDILVESHDLYIPGCEELLRARFAVTHEITAVVGKWRTLEDFPWQNGMMRSNWLREAVLTTMNEGRPCLMTWLWMKSHQPLSA